MQINNEEKKINKISFEYLIRDTILENYILGCEESNFKTIL